MTFERIPDEMKNYVQWCCWRYEETDTGKPTKVPYSPKAWGKMAAVDDPTTWCSFDEAVAGLSQGYDGIGFVFTEQDPFTGIDLDSPKDHLNAEEKKAIEARQIKVFETFDSYSERSPSGQGLHIIVRGKVKAGRKRDAIEVYSNRRYFTMTGNVFRDAPIVDRQAPLDILWDQMGQGAAKVNGFYGDAFRTNDNQYVLDQACRAQNGEKFQALLVGNWQQYYQSQSEADFAFVDIVAFYTQNREQIEEIFMASALGQRSKANRPDYKEYMINKAFDRMLPPIDIDGVLNQINETLAAVHSPTPKGLPLPVSSETPVAGPGAVSVVANDDGPHSFNDFNLMLWKTQPLGGFLGAIQKFIYDQSPRQVFEISMVGSIALMAGITGRAFNISKSGLNHYILALASTGAGKEAIASGVEALMKAVSERVSFANDFIGPADMASGTGLIRELGSKPIPCCVSIMGEIGLRLKSMSGPNPTAADTGLKRALLDLYQKSGNDQVVRKSVYAKAIDNTEDIKAPAFTLVGESVPSRFYEALDEGMISDGLLPRFIIVQYDGPRQYFNVNAVNVKPSDELVNNMHDLVLFVHDLMSKNLHMPVEQTPEARKRLDYIDQFTTEQINAVGNDVLKQLWNRVHLKTMKLAALLAVSHNYKAPIITLSDANWAASMILHDTLSLIAKFEAGVIGEKNDDSEQTKEIRRVIVDYVVNDFAKHASVPGCKRVYWDNRLIPYSYIMNKVQRLGAFKKDKRPLPTILKVHLEGLQTQGIIHFASDKDKERAGITSIAAMYAIPGFDQLL